MYNLTDKYCIRQTDRETDKIHTDQVATITFAAHEHQGLIEKGVKLILFLLISSTPTSITIHNLY